MEKKKNILSFVIHLTSTPIDWLSIAYQERDKQSSTQYKNYS